MATITYKNQPAIEKPKGSVPLAGTSHIYTVKKRLWNDSIEDVLQSLFKGTVLHLCCGVSRLGDVRVDSDITHSPDIVCDASDTKEYIKNGEIDTVLCDPPYNGKFQWNHDLLAELPRVAKKRIIFQHWFLPCDSLGRYKKNHTFLLKELLCWQPKTYFGRVQMISIFDKKIE